MKFFSKIKINRDRLSIVIYVVLTVILSYIAIKMLSISTDIITSISKFLMNIYAWMRPGLMGIILAYLIYPIVNIYFKRLSKFKYINDNKAKYLSIALAYVSIIVLVLGFFYSIYISIGGQISNKTNLNQIIEFISNFTKNDIHQNSYDVRAILSEMGVNVSYEFANYITNFINGFKNTISNSISSFGSTLVNLSESLFTIFISIILSIYFIKDAEYFLTLSRRISYIFLGNSKIANGLKIIFSVFNITFKRYIKGQLIEAFFVAIISAIFLILFGIKYALFIAIISGLTNMIPYIGPVMGTFLAGIMGILDGNVRNAIIGIILMIVVQQIDNNILAPKIVGGMVGLHPVFIIIGLIVGGKFYGVWGMAFVVPVIATIKILFKMWYESSGKDEDWTIFAKKSTIDSAKITTEVDQEFEQPKPKTSDNKGVYKLIKKIHKNSSKNGSDNENK